MAKKNRSNIQRKNIPNRKPIGHATLNHPQKAKVQNEEPEDHVQNTFLFTIIGMFAGMAVGLYVDYMALGFAIGAGLGAVIDYFVNNSRKKKFADKQDDSIT